MKKNLIFILIAALILTGITVIPTDIHAEEKKKTLEEYDSESSNSKESCSENRKRHEDYKGDCRYPGEYDWGDHGKYPDKPHEDNSEDEGFPDEPDEGDSDDETPEDEEDKDNKEDEDNEEDDEIPGEDEEDEHDDDKGDDEEDDEDDDEDDDGYTEKVITDGAVLSYYRKIEYTGRKPALEDIGAMIEYKNNMYEVVKAKVRGGKTLGTATVTIKKTDGGENIDRLVKGMKIIITIIPKTMTYEDIEIKEKNSKIVAVYNTNGEWKKKIKKNMWICSGDKIEFSGNYVGTVSLKPEDDFQKTVSKPL